MSAPKVIVLGALQGKLSTAFSRLATLQAKNNFSIALVTGDLFGSGSDDTAALLDGTIKVPLPTYFSHGSTSFPPAVASRIAADEEICPNVHFLPRNSLIKTTEGVRIFTLGGPRLDGPSKKDDGETKEADETKETTESLASNEVPDSKLLATARNADILFTTWWPTDVYTKSRVALGATPAEIPTSPSLATVSATIRPKYHFAASPGDFFYEREAFVHPHAESEPPEVTRFISMAPFGNEAKAKAIYAFSLPNTATEVPPGATKSPFYYAPAKRSRHDNDEGAVFGRFADSGDPARPPPRKQRRRNQSPPPGPDRCYFCLSNPTNSSHMCCSIGEETYLATAKGPLTTSTTWKKHNIDFPCHFIMTPLAHQPTMASIGGAEAVSTLSEMNLFRTSLQTMIYSRSKSALGAVTWEISRANNIHVHWQLLAVPAEQVHKGLVEAAFISEAENCGYPLFESEENYSLSDLSNQAAFGDYFRVWICAGNYVQSMAMPLDSATVRFDLQFGRRVLAKLLGLEKRVSWKECIQSQEEEEKDVAAFREAFKEWDFTLE